MSPPEIKEPVSQAIATMRAKLLRADEGLTADEVLDLCTWLSSIRDKHWAELRAARISAMSLRQGANVVNLETINRRYQGQGDAPADSEPRGAA